MRQFELLVTIGRQRKYDAAYPVTIRLSDGRALATTKLIFDPAVVASVQNREQIGALLEAALLDTPSRDAIHMELERTRYWLGRRILLRIIPPELFGLPWELILGHGVFQAHTDLVLVRYRQSLDPLASSPPTLPVDLLVASKEEGDRRSLLANLSVFRYFNIVESGALDVHTVTSGLGEGTADIVHLVGPGEWRDVSALTLKKSLKQAQARLLVLQGDSLSYPAALDLGHRLLGRGGPTTLVVSPGQRGQEIEPFLEDVYYGIVHDEPLDLKVGTAARRGNIRAALFSRVGGEEVLRISPIAERLRGRGYQHLAAAKAAGEVIEKKIEVARQQHPGVAVPELEEHDVALKRTISDLGNLDQQLDYSHESGGMVPLIELTRTLEKAEDTLAAVAPQAGRVVNTWFSDANGPLTQDQSLAAELEYWLDVQVGAPSVRSNVAGPHAIPEKELTRFYATEGLLLKVVLFSREFVVPEPVRELRLPPPPQETEVLRFAVIAPKAAVRRARLRACLYYEQNLLQSVLIMARITPAPRRGLSPGNRGEVDFALTGSLREPDRLPARTLNILTNDADGTHTFAVVGTKIRKQLDFDAMTLETAVKNARAPMQQICSEVDSTGKPVRYRFEPDNRGAEPQFVKDLVILAEAGSALYDSILNRNSAFETEVADALRQPAKVQVAATRSAKYVFPWALVYEKPLVRSGNTICNETLGALRNGGAQGFLSAVRCFKGDCPNEADSKVICPSRFWGFKHVFEQPLSAAVSNGSSGSVNGEMPRFAPELVLKIEASSAVALMMAVSEKLDGVAAHEGEIKALPRVNFDHRRSSKLEIGTELARQDLHVVYFYCHGGRTTREPFLGVGQTDRIFPAELRGWKVSWAQYRPLVFINGCHTVDLSPADLVSFNESFARCHAAGVIGTEISVPETLARAFAHAFFKRLVGGAKVGQIVHDLRMALLEQYNPLGLVYTPYCSADLEVVFQ